MSEIPAKIDANVEARRRLPVARIVFALLAVVTLIWLGREAGAYIPKFAAWVDDLGFWGPLVFVAGYGAAVVAFVPGSILSLAAGAIFGLAKGTIYEEHLAGIS